MMKHRRAEAKKNPRGSRFADIKAALAAMGISMRRKDGEYRVSYAGRGNEASAYYTTDMEDAFGTGKHMANEAAMKRVKKNPRRKFGKRRTLKSAVKKIGAHVPKRHVIVAKVDGVKFFFNGRGFDSVGAHAARYVDKKFAASVARSIRGVLPHKIKSLSVEAL